MSLSKPIQLHIANESVKYILFQRTQYLFFRTSRWMQWLYNHLPKFISYRLETLFTKFNTFVSIESFFRRKKVADLFSEEMFCEYEQIERHLPKNASTILDIGSGIGGFDVLLNAHYNSLPKFYLLDKTEMPRKVYYGIEKKASFYNSFDVTKKFLSQNGVPDGNVFVQEANDKNTIGFDTKFDLVISLISWGFHYPVETYLDEVYEKLVLGGVLIIDVRKSTGGIELLQEKFGNAEIIHDAVKHSRAVAIK